MYDTDSIGREIIRQQAQTARDLQLAMQALRTVTADKPRPAQRRSPRFALHLGRPFARARSKSVAS